jgi:hypothetical protein
MLKKSQAPLSPDHEDIIRLKTHWAFMRRTERERSMRAAHAQFAISSAASIRTNFKMIS